MNRLTIILLTILCGVLQMCPSNTWYDTPIEMGAGDTLLDILPRAASQAQVQVRLSAPKGKASSWSIAWGTDSLWRVTVSLPRCDRHEDIRHPTVNLCVSVGSGDSTREVANVEIDNMDTYGRYNTLKLVLADGRLRILGGAEMQKFYCEIPHCPALSGVLWLNCSTEMKCQYLQIETFADLSPYRSRYVNDTDIYEHLRQSTDPTEGVWEYMDRNTDAKKAVIGGRYRVAVVAVDDVYEIVYLDGAEINSAKWQKMQIKGRLTPTIFEGNFDMEWYDADLRLLQGDNNAQLSADGAILTLRFPELKAEMRLRRVKGF